MCGYIHFYIEIIMIEAESQAETARITPNGLTKVRNRVETSGSSARFKKVKLCCL
jgi:hypothetical protein